MGRSLLQIFSLFLALLCCCHSQSTEMVRWCEEGRLREGRGAGEWKTVEKIDDGDKRIRFGSRGHAKHSSWNWWNCFILCLYVCIRICLVASACVSLCPLHSVNHFLLTFFLIAYTVLHLKGRLAQAVIPFFFSIKGLLFNMWFSTRWGPFIQNGLYCAFYQAMTIFLIIFTKWTMHGQGPHLIIIFLCKHKKLYL